MVTYPYVVENLALLSLGLLLQAWKISWTIMLCKFLDTGYNFVRTPFTVKVAMIYLICPLLLRCAIYRLPDAHEHITRPPQGVKFPKKVSNLVASYLLQFSSPFPFLVFNFNVCRIKALVCLK